MATQSSSSCVYVKDDEFGWLPANVISYDGDAAKVSVAIPSGASAERDVNLTDYEAKTLPLQNADESGNLIEMADMCDLPSLHEAAILYNLKARHEEKKPYTRVGDIIIAMNPFQWIDGLYSDETREEYVDKLIWSTAPDGDPKAGLDPHVYETSSLAFRGLAINDHHQSILVTGESGAGKTETVKIIMSHLASIQSTGISSSDQTKEHISHDPRSNVVVRRVLDSNPLLEAFGNAKTVRNDNSSRFGKYIQLQFDVEDATTAAFKGKAVPSCLLAGSNCETYLLEKSRVVGHEEEERTYHIFYQLLAAPQDVKAEVWDGLMGADTSSFKYVGHTDTTKIEGRTDEEKWYRTVDALATVGVTGETLITLMRAVCTVMQLGNLEFEADPSNEDGSVISSTGELAKLAGLLGVETVSINEALTKRTVTAGRGRETYSVPLKPGAARDGRDAFAKEIYQQTFDWLVRAINGATSAESNYPDASDVDEFGIIGLLDIFGFESFIVNRFEQLCINYANEKLQQKYTLDIFRSVQEEYEFEGIELGEVTFSDNAEVLNLIEGRMGIVAVLNEECVRPNGNDSTFVSKVKTVNKDIECLINEQLHRPTEFAIQHYAGEVKYDATNFVTKNMDTLAKDLIDCACKSNNELIRTELQNAADAKAETTKVGRGRGAGAVTVSANFRSQLTALMHNIGQTRTRYVRCIKPNPEKKPIAVCLKSSTEQLRCAGVVAAVNVSRAAFPNRLMHQTALERFQYLSSSAEIQVRQWTDDEKKDGEDDSTGLRMNVETLLSELLKEMEVTGNDGVAKPAFCCGKSRVYFRAGALERLESDRLEALGVFAIAIERMARGFTARSKFSRTKEATVSSQAMARRTIARKDFLRSRKAATAISCWVRCIFAKTELVRLRRERACTLLQTRCRIYLAKSEFASCKSSAIVIQKIARGAKQRPIYRAMLKEAREEAVVNKKLAALQKRLAAAEMKWMQADRKRIEAEKIASGMGTGTGAGKGADLDSAGVEEEKKEEVDKELMDESLEMLEVLKKDVFNLRSKNFLLRADYTELKDAYQNLVAQNASMAASHEALKQHAAHLSQTNKSMLFKATKDKKENSDKMKELNTDKFKLRGEVAALKKQLELKDAAHEKELAQMRSELEKLKEKQVRSNERARPPMQPSSKGPPVMKRASFNTRSASFHTGRSLSPPDVEGAWDHSGYHQMYGNKRESRNPSATSNYRSRGRRGKGRSPRGNPRHQSNRGTPPTSRNNSRHGRKELPKSSGSRASASGTSSVKDIPRVASKSSLSEAAKGVPKVDSRSSLAARSNAPSVISPTSSLSAAASKRSSLSHAKGGKQKE